METSEITATIDLMHAEAQRRGLFFQHSSDERLEGRRLKINGRDVLAYTSCSYLGLEYHPRMIAGACDAAQRFGTQFSSSRAYVSAPLYTRLEEALGQLFGGHVLVTSSTTMAHQAALPTLVTEKDAIVYDNQVHRSVQVAITLCKAAGTTVEMVRHRELEQSLEAVRRLAARHRTVWFACDGVYSMYGDLAPFGLLRAILDTAPNVRLYVDDAHGMSWIGQHGRGAFLHNMPLTDRIVLATSFAKAFGAGGGCLVFANQAEREFVRRAGAAQLFNGPMQPPMLGAVLAGAEIHLSNEIVERQDILRDRVLLTNRLLIEAGLPLLARNETPIFYLGLGRPETSFAVAERMLEAGVYLNVAMYPTVPLKRSGIRLAITALHSEEDIRRTVGLLAEHVPAVLEDQGIQMAEIEALFKGAVPEESRVSHVVAADLRRFAIQSRAVTRANQKTDGLTLLHERSIHAIDRTLWNDMLGAVGAISWDALATAEKVFQGHDAPEHNWGFHYLIAKDSDGQPLCATMFADLLHKDDMFMRAEISDAVERRRELDPYFLTTRALAMGGYLSEGPHVFLNRTGPWRDAFGAVLDRIEEVYESTRSGMIVLRDFPNDDAEMDSFLAGRGYVKVPLMQRHIVEITWNDTNQYLNILSRRSRSRMRDRLAAASAYHATVYGVSAGRPLPNDLAAELYALYRNVASRKRRLNVFPYPDSLVHALAESPAWEIVTLQLDPSHGGPRSGSPVAWYAAHRFGDHYAPVLIGLDYRYVENREYGAYRQALLRMLFRAQEIGAKWVHLGMDADFDKALLGAVATPACAYVQIRDHHNGEVLREIISEIGLKH